MGLSDMEFQTICLVEQLFIIWQETFDAAELARWINKYTPVRVTWQDVAVVLASE